MNEHPIHDALTQVRTLQELILNKQMFRGFSGRARILSGIAALLAALLLAGGIVPDDRTAHLITWALVLALALTLNFGALVFAFFFEPAFRRDPARMKPALDIVPPLAVGAGLSLALVLAGQYDLLFGTWMSLYGLAHLSARHSLPPANFWVGIFYLASGALCLLRPGLSFLNPWPMALAFFPGEIAGGIILSALRSPPPAESQRSAP